MDAAPSDGPSPRTRLTGADVAELRRRLGLTVLDLAQATGDSRSLISAVECGHVGISDKLEVRILAVCQALISAHDVRRLEGGWPLGSAWQLALDVVNRHALEFRAGLISASDLRQRYHETEAVFVRAFLVEIGRVIRGEGVGDTIEYIRLCCESVRWLRLVAEQGDARGTLEAALAAGWAAQLRAVPQAARPFRRRNLRGTRAECNR